MIRTMLGRSTRGDWAGIDTADAASTSTTRAPHRVCVMVSSPSIRARDRDSPDVLAGVLERHANGTGILAWQTLGPLDREDALRGERVEAEIVDLARRQPVQVDVEQREPARVLLDERERGAAHVV